MRFSLILVLLVVSTCGCSRQESGAEESTIAKANPPELEITFRQIYDMVSDESMPAADLVQLFASLDKASVEWDVVILEESSPGNFLLGPDRQARGGITMFPPKGWAAILRDLNQFTPLRVRGTLEDGYHGLRLNASFIELRDEVKAP